MSVEGAGFDVVQGVGEAESHEEGCDELAAIVAVEMDLRQQVAQGNAQERARRKGQHIADHRPFFRAKQFHTSEARYSYYRAQSGKADIGQCAGARAVTGGLHHADNGVRIERLVQQNGEEYP